MPKKYGILLMIVLLFFKLSAQTKNVESQNLLWTKYVLKLRVNEKWTPFFDVEERMYMFPFRQHHFLPNIGVTYTLDSNFSLTGSMMYFQLTLPQDPNADFKELFQELRPQIALNFKHNINDNWTFLSRFKAEWRYIKLPTQNEFAFRNYRFRMRMGIKYKFNDKWDANLLEEIHINVGKNVVRNVFDQNRLSAGLNYNFNSNFGFESGYMYWFQQQFSGVDFFSRNIVYFTLKHNIQL